MVLANKLAVELVVACKIEDLEFVDIADLPLHIVAFVQVERHLGGGSSGLRHTMDGKQVMEQEQGGVGMGLRPWRLAVVDLLAAGQVFVARFHNIETLLDGVWSMWYCTSDWQSLFGE